MRRIGEERDYNNRGYNGNYNDNYYNDGYAYDDYGYDGYNYSPNGSKKHKKRSKKIFKRIFTVLFIAVCAWLLYSVIGSFATGQKYSVLGPGSKDVRNIVVAGVDEGGYRTDLILLCHIDRTKNELNILQIPRDTKIDNKRNDKKINSAFFSGFECMSKEISKVTGILPEGYIMVSFDGFNEIIDALGGVTVDVPVRMNYSDPVQNLTIDLQPGKQHLDGEHAQMFMRFRKNNDGSGYTNGDIDRINTQKLLYSAVINKIKSPLVIIRAPFLLGALKRHTTTNLEGEFTGVFEGYGGVRRKCEFLFPSGRRQVYRRRIIFCT